MKDAQGREVTGRVRWRKFAVLAVPGFAATAALAVALAQGALAASFAVSGQEFKVTAKSLDGDGFVQYGGVDRTVRKELVPVAVTAIKHAKLTDMCQSVVTHLGPLGDITLKLHAGGGGKPAEATDLFVDATQLSGDASFDDLQLGQDASTLNKGPKTAQGMQDAFGQQSTHVSITGLHQTARATNAGKFTLAGLSLNLSKGADECK
ncbi:DUF6230 family protein [Streptomyces orinoci]|uniref:DUF6230 family protein n=1 Tax=Streptomyces orinoci TaxID=67339 RepID=A0ABV3JPV9_STRON|nr:DUF6230 family protein [Streptomyces orinoci]